MSDFLALITSVGVIGALVYNAMQYKLFAKQFELEEKQAKLNYNLAKLNHKQRTLEYVTTQFDKLTKIGAREEMAKTKEKNIKNYIKDYIEQSELQGERKAEEIVRIKQLFLEYAYTFNRIGAGIRDGSLDKDIVFNVWSPSFFKKHWEKYRDFLEDERKSGIANAYSYFDWLGTRGYDENINEYPQERSTLSK